MEERNLRFPIYSDAGNAVARQFGLVFDVPDDVRKHYLDFDIDLPRFNGDESWTLPMPARYVVDTEGRITYARVHPDYTTRPEPEETLEALK